MYCQPDEEGRVDVSGKEYMELRRLIALADAVLEKTSRLDQRAKIAAKGTYRDLCLLRKLATKVSGSLCDTIPTKRLKLIKKELAHTVCRIEVQPTNGLPATKHEEYTTVPLESMLWLIDRTLKWECTLCEKEGKEQKKCPFRQRLDACFPYELQDVRKGECPFMTMQLLGDAAP